VRHTPSPLLFLYSFLLEIDDGYRHLTAELTFCPICLTRTLCRLLSQFLFWNSADLEVLVPNIERIYAVRFHPFAVYTSSPDFRSFVVSDLKCPKP